MKNKIVQLKDGRTTCRILDSIIINGNTMYLIMEFEKGVITTIKPTDIWDIVERNSSGEFDTIKNWIIEKGI